MRILVTEKERDLEELAASVARTPRAAGAALERIRQLNPHLAEAKKVPKGGMLLLPEGTDIKAGVGTSISGVSLENVAASFDSGIRAVATRASSRFETLAADQSAVRTALKGAAAKRVVDADPLLKKQLAAADAQFKAEQKLATESRDELAELSKVAQAEFERLLKLIG